MKRRTLVRAAAAGSVASLGGCIDQFSSEADPEFEIEPRSIDDADERPVEYAARLVETEYADPETPLTVEVEITNRLDEAVTFGEERRARFHEVASADGGFGLFPADKVDAIEEADVYAFRDDCWILAEPYGILGDYRTAKLDAGESVSSSLYLLPWTDECPESTPKEVTFTTDITVWKRGPTPGDRDEQVGEYEWGFTLVRI